MKRFLIRWMPYRLFCFAQDFAREWREADEQARVRALLRERGFVETKCGDWRK